MYLVKYYGYEDKFNQSIESFNHNYVLMDYWRETWWKKINKKYIYMECPVCLENYKIKKYVFPCKHNLCSNCFKNIHSKKCPLCRGKMEKLIDDRCYTNDDTFVKTSDNCEKQIN